MKQSKIYMKRWLGANERSQQVATDTWYLDFANRLLSILEPSTFYRDRHESERAEATVSFTLYLQDVIAQCGGWKTFSDAYRQHYGTHLPFYTLTDAYLPDEINTEDIAFILWTLTSRIAISDEDSFVLQDPLDADLLALSQSIYDFMNGCFEEAPICDTPSSPLWVMGTDLLEIPETPLPEITPGSIVRKDVQRCLEYSKGNPLLFFATYIELCTFLVGVLGWEDQPSSLLPELTDLENFIIYANAKGMLIAPEAGVYFNDPKNPLYDATLTDSEGYEMFCIPGACPFDLLKYGMAHHLLLDIQLPFPNGKELFKNNWDFIARYFLCEYYEGE